MYREPLCLHPELPFVVCHLAAHQRALPLLHRSYGLMSQTKILFPPSVYKPRRGVLAGCCRPLLEDGLSRCYLRNPCMGARSRTAQCLSSAFARFFLENFGLTLLVRSSTHWILAAMQLLRRVLFRGCRHSFMFKLPYSLAPLIAPTAKDQRL